jgi:hypothetical protein
MRLAMHDTRWFNQIQPGSTVTDLVEVETNFVAGLTTSTTSTTSTTGRMLSSGAFSRFL